MVDVVGRIDGWWNDLRLEVLGADPPPQVIGVRFPESWSSTSLAKKRCQKHRQDSFVLDTAFTLIEGHPQWEWCTQRTLKLATCPMAV